VSSEFEELRQQTQRNFVEFLSTELDLGFSFERTARLQAQMGNPDGFEHAREDALEAIRTVERFNRRIADPEIRIELQERADELAKFISEFEPPKPRSTSASS